MYGAFYVAAEKSLFATFSFKAAVSEKGAPDNWPDVVNTQQQSGRQGALRSLPTREEAYAATVSSIG